MAYKRKKRWRGLPVPLRLPAVLAAVVLVLLVIWAVLPKDRNVPEPVIAPEWVEQSLLPVNQFSRPGVKLDAINGIVVHYTGNPGTTAEQNRNYFAGLAESGEASASSNFIIGLEGEVLQAVPTDEVAYASSQRNHDTISIEVCHSDDSGVFGAPTQTALVALVQWLVDFYELDRDQVLRHYDVTGKECPRWFVQHPEDWEGFLDELDFSHRQTATVSTPD